jgi:hypothetical protein
MPDQENEPEELEEETEPSDVNIFAGKRKENTVYFVNKDERRALPINKIYSIISNEVFLIHDR